jgi:hypothetical protein
MPQLTLVGLLAPPELTTAFPTLARLFAEELGVSWAFVQRQDHPLAVGTTFQALNTSPAGHQVTSRYRLVAISQQYGALWTELPPGWNGLCAFQMLGAGPDVVAGLPVVNGWYAQPAYSLVLTAE